MQPAEKKTAVSGTQDASGISSAEATQGVVLPTAATAGQEIVLPTARDTMGQTAETETRTGYDGITEETASFKIGRTVENKPFVEVEEDILDGIPEGEWTKKVNENLREKFPNGITAGKDIIKINQKSRREMTFSAYMQWLRKNEPQAFSDKLRATNNIDELILAAENWVNEGVKHNRKDTISSFARGNVLMKVGGNNYTADVVVGIKETGEALLYDVINLQPTTIIENETNTLSTEYPSPGVDRSNVSVSNDSIPQTASLSQENTTGNVFGGNVLPTAKEAQEQMQREQRAAKAETETERTGILLGVSDEVIREAVSVSKALGVDVLFYRDIDGEVEGDLGYYNHNNGKIYLNADIKNPASFILGHEMIHHIQLTKGYLKFADAVLKKIQQDGGNLDAMRKKTAERYKKKKVVLTSLAKIDQEIIAEYAQEHLFTNEADIISVVNADKETGHVIKRFLDNVLAKLGNKNARERAFVARARSLYAKALRENVGIQNQLYGRDTARVENAEEGTAGNQSANIAEETRLQEKFAEETRAKTESAQEEATRDYTEENMQDESDAAMDILEAERSMAGESMLYDDGRQYAIAKDEDTEEIFSASQEDTKKLSAQVDSWLQGEMRSDQYFEFGKTPEVLKQLGAQNLPIVMNQSVMAKITGGSHAVALDAIKDIPNAMADPVMVFKSNTVKNAFVVITEIVDKEGADVIVALHLNKFHNENRINRIASVYGKKNIQNFIESQSEIGNLKYIDKNKSQVWSIRRGLQLPELNAILDSNNSILQKGNVVNRYGIKKSGKYAQNAENKKISMGEQYGDGRQYAIEREKGVANEEENNYNNTNNELGGIIDGRKVDNGRDRRIQTKTAGKQTGEGAHRSRRVQEGIYREGDTEGRSGKNVHYQDSEGRRISEEDAVKLKNTAIVDENGHPLATYHFTQDMHFNVFKRGDIGFHFGTLAQANKRRKDLGANKGRVFRAYLNIQNPVRLSADIMNWHANALALRLWSDGVITDAERQEIESLWSQGGEYDSPAAVHLREILEEKKYDGIVYPNGFEGDGDSYIAFHDEQIIKTGTENISSQEDGSDNIQYAIAKDTAETEKADRPLSQKEVAAIYAEVKRTRRNLESVQRRMRLSDEDKMHVGRLLRGELTAEYLPEDSDAEGVVAVYKAKLEYENYAKRIREWNEKRKEGLRARAQEYLANIRKWKDKTKFGGLRYSIEMI